MKTIAISAIAALAFGASFAADEPPTTPAEKTAAVEKRTSKTLKVSDVAKDKKLTPEEREAKIAEMKRKQQECIEARRKAIEARVAAAEEAAAKEKGITVEELRRQRGEKMAKAAGMSFEEWSKLDKEAQNAKLREVTKAKMLERDKIAAEKAGISLEEYLQQREAKRKGVKRAKAADKPMPGAKRVETPVCNGTSCELPSAEAGK